MYASLDAESLDQVKACIETGLECVDPERRNRPSIDRIVQKFNVSTDMEGMKTYDRDVLCTKQQLFLMEN